MAEKRDYYEVLGVEKNADDQTIKRAFKRLAMKYHPDRNKEPGAEEKFKEINEAYAVLSDQQKRATYDQYGFAGVDPNQGGFGGGGFGGFGGGGFDFGDIFGQAFGDIFGGAGGRRRGPSVQPGEDLQLQVSITLEEAVKGIKKKFKINKNVTCDCCHGTGAEAGSSTKECPTCHGAGVVLKGNGIFRIQETCPNCHGRGKIFDKPCKKCNGEGRYRDKQEVEVDIPAGVDDGMRMTLRGYGEAGRNGAPSGDLFVFIRVKPHPIFERDGMDLYVDVPISITTATLGGKVEVPTLDGKISLTVKEGTQSGTQLRAKGKGIPSLHGAAVGDLYCRIIVEVPVNLNNEQKELLKKFDDSISGNGAKSSNNLPGVKGFFDKVKSFFDSMSDSKKNK